MPFTKLPFSFLLALVLIVGPAANLRAATTGGWKLINLDLDGSVSAQRALAPKIDERKDLTALQNCARLWTGRKGLKKLRGAIAELREKYPEKWLTFMGSGDFHQVAAMLIESLPAQTHPLTVIQIDNHPDWFRAPEHYHCGAWVAQALRHPWVERVILIGQDSPDLTGYQFHFVTMKELRNGRAELHPLERKKSLVPLMWGGQVKGVDASHVGLWGTRLDYATVREQGAGALADRLAARLAGKNVYISIDKDVLDKQSAITDWDQGRLSITELQSLIEKISRTANLVGADVCGEMAPERIKGLFKIVDSGRGLHWRKPDWTKVNAVNEQTNLRIVESFERSRGRAGGE